MWTKYSLSVQPQSRKFVIPNGTRHSQPTYYAPLRRLGSLCSTGGTSNRSNFSVLAFLVNSNNLTLMFCSATVPPDDFIANCKFPLSDLIGKAEQPLHEIWVDLEPNGKLHVKIELLWATQDEQNQPNRAFQVNSLSDEKTQI